MNVLIPFLDPLAELDIADVAQLTAMILWTMLTLRVFAGADKKLSTKEFAQSFIIIAISWMLYAELTREHEWRFIHDLVWVFFMTLLVIVARAEMALKWIYRIKHGKDINGNTENTET